MRTAWRSRACTSLSCPLTTPPARSCRQPSLLHSLHAVIACHAALLSCVRGCVCAMLLALSKGACDNGWGRGYPLHAQVPALQKHLQETLRTPEDFLKDQSEGQGISGRGSVPKGRSLREVEMEKPAVEEEDD